MAKGFDLALRVSQYWTRIRVPAGLSRRYNSECVLANEAAGMLNSQRVRFAISAGSASRSARTV